MEDEEITSEEASPHDSGGQRLDRLLEETVEDILSRVFSGEVASLILRKVGEKSSLEPGNQAWSVEVFSDVLRKLLGSSSIIVERLILKGLFSKLGLDFIEKEGYRFLDYIKELKEKRGC